MLVFGAGTDYALLLISRYRDELRTHEDRHEAMRIALRRTSHAVLASATTVVLGVLSLVLSLFPTTRGLGIACAVGIVVAATFALVALPATLVLFGRWVFWPKVPRIGSESLAEGRSLWRRVGDAVSRRTAAFVVGTLLLLGVPLRRSRRHRARPAHRRPVPAEAGGDLRGPGPGEVLPRGQLRPRLRAHPHTGRGEARPSRTSTASTR